MAKTRKTIIQNGAEFLITIEGSPHEVAREIARLFNYGLINAQRGQDNPDKGTPVFETDYKDGLSDSVTVRSNLPRFESGVRALAVTRLRKDARRLRLWHSRGIRTRKAIALECEAIKSEFGHAWKDTKGTRREARLYSDNREHSAELGWTQTFTAES